MRRAVAIVSLVAAVLCAAAVAYGASVLASYSWNQVAEYRSPYLGMLPKRAPESVPGTQPATVVLIIVDGMRDDISRSAMPAIEKLRQYGGDYVLTAGEPSLSYPGWTTILTGAPQEVSGVTTNWFEGRVKVPDLMKIADDAGREVIVVGPPDLDELYGVKAHARTTLVPWPETGDYLSGTLVNAAIRHLEADADLLVLHLPDLDEAGHEHGGASPEYRAVAERIDGDISRLVARLQSEKVVIAVASDHGHIDTGGHGGWEPEVVKVPFVLAGEGVELSEGVGALTDIAPTISALMRVPAPAYAAGTVLAPALADGDRLLAVDAPRLDAFLAGYATVSSETTWTPQKVARARAVQGTSSQFLGGLREAGFARDRERRADTALLMAMVALGALVLTGLVSWRALVAVVVGVLAYAVVYDGLYLVVHGHQWSLSAFNSEDLLGAFFNLRMVEAAVGGCVAALVAGIAYPYLRTAPKGARGEYLWGWLALGPVTVLGVQAVLAVQVAWYLWYGGATVTWALPDLKWAFKYDLDLVQATALGAAAALSPLVTFAVGRLHPAVREK